MPVDQFAYKQNVEKIRHIAEKMDEDVLGLPGWILYSSYKTLVRGDYYFLGVNPAGSGEDRPKTVRDSLDSLIRLTEEADKNQFLDISWYDDPKETKLRPLQERFKFLFETALRVDDAHTICASNLIFPSSKKESSAGGWPMAEKCWPVHEAIIQEIVQPRVIITHGNLPFDFISGKLGGRPLGKPQLCGHANWTWRCSRLEKTGQKLIGLPHMSIYAINSPDRAGIVEDIVKQIQSD